MVGFRQNAINNQGVLATSRLVTQATHGFVVGNTLSLSGSTYVLAKADTAANCENVGIVTSVVDTNNFVISCSPWISGLSGLTAGTVYFQSEITAGLLTATQPTSVGTINKPILVADSTTSGYLVNYRGEVNTANLAFVRQGLFIQTATQTVANTLVATSAFSTGVGTKAISANTLNVGTVIILTGYANLNTIAVSAGNLTVVAKLGSVTLASVVITNLAASLSNVEAMFTVRVTIRTTGASGTAAVSGQFSYPTGLLSARDSADLNNGGTVVTGIDTTTSLTPDLTVQWATASPSNSLAFNDALIERIN